MGILVAIGLTSRDIAEPPVRDTVDQSSIDLSLPGTPDFAALFTLYAAGDYDVVRRNLNVAESFRDIRGLNGLVATWLGSEWVPVRATFLLEVAIAAADRSSPDTLLALLSLGRSYLEIRTTVASSDVRWSGFEREWHRIAVALLQGRLLWKEQEDYLIAVAKRLKVAKAPGVDSRSLLALAVARSQRCCTRSAVRRLDDQLAGSAQRTAPNTDTTVATPRPPTRSRSTLFSSGTARSQWESQVDASIHIFGEAAKLSDTRPEALVRGAHLFLLRHRASKALEWLDRVNEGNPDRELVYWTRLFRGRAFDALHRPIDAERSYRAALEVWPHAQSAGVGLALSLMRLGRATEAAEVAVAALNARTDDPFWIYERADVRFVSVWRERLRAANR